MRAELGTVGAAMSQTSEAAPPGTLSLMRGLRGAKIVGACADIVRRSPAAAGRPWTNKPVLAVRSPQDVRRGHDADVRTWPPCPSASGLPECSAHSALLGVAEYPSDPSAR